jgi:epoxyqueuosine reductase
MARCPVNAISKAGHEKTKCKQYTNVKMNALIRKTYKISTYACGLCQAGVPCTDHIPEPDEG